MTPGEFIAKWSASELKERSGAQEHFIDLCRLLGEPTPAEADPRGEHYCFERGARKDIGGDGWADVWKRGCFGWEYKGKHANLDGAYNQLRQYALALENPPLLIVSDMVRFRIRTNWTNSVSEMHEFVLDDLGDAGTRDKLKWAMSDPERLRPGESRQTLTERAAATFAELAQSLRERSYDPQPVAHFVNRLVFCMFAEDVGLLPDNLFSRMLEHGRRRPDAFVDLAHDLFGAMATGGRVGFETVAHFNGGLFDDDSALPLSQGEIETALRASALDWSEVDPSILGTLFERGLDPDKRSQLGAHYTDRDKIERIVEPVVVRPLLAKWEREKAKIAVAVEKGGRAPRRRSKSAVKASAAQQLLNAFLARVQSFTVLDPACGSGNFLYVALHTLKDLEHRVQLEAEAMGLERSFPAVGPANVKGIEINAYAAELARVSVWIGEIQWMRRNGFDVSRNPILKPLETIECRDAILRPDGAEPDWPEADVVIGNPPFLGYSPQREVLGHSYIEAVRKLYKPAVPAFADLVCYWFHKAGTLVSEGKLARAGLVATNSIRGGKNRAVLDRIVAKSEIYDAWSNEPWIVDGAAVRVSLVCFSPKNTEQSPRLDGSLAKRINADLTATSDLTAAVKLPENRSTAFIGGMKKGSFDVPGDLARDWLQLPTNPNGRPNADVLKPWMNGKDVTRRPSGKWIVDFGHHRSESEAALYEASFAHIRERVWPTRERNNRKDLRRYWWRHDRSGRTLFERLTSLPRYIATPRVSKHRLFVWLDSHILPDGQLVVIARDDDTTFGILHSRFHEAWALGLCTWLGKGDDPRYTPTTTFETFPFPEGLSPGIKALGLRSRSTGGCYCGGGAAARGIARPLAEPARMGRVGGRARSGLSEAPGTSR